MMSLCLSMHNADGVLMFCKQKFSNEIKLHGGQHDIHEEIYH